ncbi:protein FAR1-RELATED SEQUENCE 2-like [Rosa rugosa]|uniref:protein FAR1-RELATED SEQUENCE 2-like n=1 Tax=Rosa rugosa TaxID=74645 RepID=UPI002B41058B|nr:protein FAR1-RELATED SEQUENCE 2-like [Rosa rugosa]
MKIRYDLLSRKYSVVEFVADHTHVTSTPSKTHLFRSHGKISLAQIVQADMAYDSGINPKKTLELLSRQAGGREHLGFIPEDYRNYLRSKQTREMKSGDTGGVLEYVQRMQLNDPNFVYAIQVDEDDLITNIFWADAKMMVDYDYFGDVVCFDTTYKKNKEGRPFAMFVGVKNHKQTLIFAKHLSNVTFEKFKDFAEDFSSIIYDYEDVEDFLIAWKKMLEKYNLQENKWLGRLFDLKEKWALVYGRETFCADITTTQRSESMNNSIKKYVSYKYDLLRFFRHFQRLLDDRRYNESVADFKASQTTPALSFPVKILRNAAKVYTPAVFQWFQVELCKAHDCTLKLFGEIGTMRIYEVIAHGKRFHHTILSTNNIKTIPSQHISKRWIKDIRDQRAKVSCPNANDDDQKAKIARLYRELARLHTELATSTAESDEAYEIATVALHKTLADVKASLKKKINQEAPQVASPIINSALEVIFDNFDDHRVRGIKVKERIVRKEEFVRPKNALEKLLGNKRHKKEVDTYRDTKENQN